MNLVTLLFSLFATVVVGIDYAYPPAPEPIAIEDLSDAVGLYGGEDV